MSQTPDYAAWEARVGGWAEARPDIRVILVVGARARRSPGPEAWSDLDLIVYTTQPDLYVPSGGWLDGLGRVWTAVLGMTSHDPEWLVLFTTGVKIDFVIAALPVAARTVQDIVDTSPYPSVLAAGVRVLVDKLAPVGERLRLPAAAPLALPSQEQFCYAVQALWLEAARAAHYLARDDLWRAQCTLNGALRASLLMLLEWQAASQGRRPQPGGRFLSQWGDPAGLAALPDTFAGYDRVDLWRALLALVDLSTRLADEIASRLDYRCDARGAEVRAWLEALCGDDRRATDG